MIDTVSLRFDIGLDPLVYRSIKWDRKRQRCGIAYLRHESIAGGDFDFAYYPYHVFLRRSVLIIKWSLPKVLFGNNACMIGSDGEYKEAVQKSAKLLATIPWLPSLDITTAPLARVDFCYNFQEGEWVQERIRLISLLHMGKRKIEPYYGGGINFRVGKECLVIYDKELESTNKNHPHPAAKGVLRMEDQIKGMMNISRRTGLDFPCLAQLNLEIAEQVLNYDLHKLKLDEYITSSEDQSLHILREKYGRLVGDSLYGFYMVRNKTSYNQMLSSGYSRKTLQRKEKKIKDAGLTIGATQSISLPALRIDFGKGQ